MNYLTVADVARAHGVSRQRVHQIIASIPGMRGRLRRVGSTLVLSRSDAAAITKNRLTRDKRR